MLTKEAVTAAEDNPSPRQGDALTHLLRGAAYEMKQLRHANEVLSAKAEVLEIFKAALLGPPRMGGASPDILWALEREIERREKSE